MKINISEIRIDGGTQSRVAIDQQVVEDYAEAIKVGIKFPEITLFFDGAVHWLVDGFHRYHAHRYAKKVGIDASVVNGTLREAILYSVGANSDHGLRRSNEDKRKAVNLLLADAEWSQWPEQRIAEQCVVSRELVRKVKAELVTCTNLQVTTPNVGVAPPAQVPPKVSAKAAEITASGGSPRYYNDKHGNVSVMDVSGLQRTRKTKEPEPKPAPEPDPMDDAGINVGDELERETHRANTLEDRIVAMQSDDKAKKIDELMLQLQHAVREKDVEMDKNARLQRELGAADRFRTQVVKLAGAKDPQAALQWVKSMAATQRKSA